MHIFTDVCIRPGRHLNLHLWTWIETTGNQRWRPLEWNCGRQSSRWSSWSWSSLSWSSSWPSWSSSPISKYSYHWQMWRPSELSWQWIFHRFPPWSDPWSTAGRPQNWKKMGWWKFVKTAWSEWEIEKLQHQSAAGALQLKNMFVKEGKQKSAIC